MARIGINLVFLDPARMGGAETYCRHLVRELQLLPEVAAGGHRFFLFVPRRHDVSVISEHFHLVACDVDASRRQSRILWEQAVLPLVLERHELDLVHFPYCTGPLLYAGRSVVTIHDALRIVMPRLQPWLEHHYRQIVERHLASAGAHVIAMSDDNVGLLRRDLGIPRRQISRVYPGVDEAFFQAGSAASPAEYVLWVGRPTPVKNLEVLLDAWTRLCGTGPPPPRLRLIGAAGDEALCRDIGRCGLGDRIRAEHYVPHSQLPALYAGALALVYPSLHESFGMPVMEAMAAGTPVVCSDIPAFREIAGDAAIFCPPRDAEAFASAVRTVAIDHRPRHITVARGRQRAAAFTWSRCAAQTMAVYERILNSHGSPAFADNDSGGTTHGSPRADPEAGRRPWPDSCHGSRW